MNYRKIQEIWRHHRQSLMMSRTLTREEVEKSGSEEPLQSTLISCFSVRTRRKSLDGGKCHMSVTNHAMGIGTCIQGMTIPSYLSSEMHL